VRDGALIVRRIAAALLLAGCAPSVVVPAAHPARADAPTGRLAGPPAALRKGVVDDAPAPAPEPPPAHEHHH
jgi:hypothetical protein